jgi:hypothetical protein
LAARGSPAKESGENVGATLATIERALKAGSPLNRLELIEWIGNDVLANSYGEPITSWAVRVADNIFDAMTIEEREQWRTLVAGEAA